MRRVINPEQYLTSCFMGIVETIGAGAGALIGGGLSLVGSVLGSNAQSDAVQNAANTSASASNYAADIQKQMYDQTRADQTPWRDAGVNALAQLNSGTAAGGSLVRPFSMSDYQADPGYAFRLSEGIKALDRSASARGQLASGSALKAAERYGQDYASNEYQNAYNRYQSNQTNQFNRLASMAGLGQTANNALQSANSTYGNAITGISTNNAAIQANAGLAAGQANASMYQGIGNALGSAFSNWKYPQTATYNGYTYNPQTVSNDPTYKFYDP